MSKNTYKLTPADFADILGVTLAMAAEAGLTVGVREAPANKQRPAGVMLYISGLTTADGAIIERVERLESDETVQDATSANRV